jgi:curved DNA-binding protein CbpA
MSDQAPPSSPDDVSPADCYATLHVTRNASLDVIHAAYRAQIKTAHPDRGGDEAAFRVLQEAYETLCDPDRRADLARLLDTRQTPPASRSTATDHDRVYVDDPLAEDLPSGWYRDTDGRPPAQAPS